MSSETVPEQRVELVDSGILNGTRVRSQHWVHAPRASNWLAGRPRQLVPSHTPLVTISSGSSSEFWYRVRPNYQATRLRYSILLTAETPCGANISIPTSTARPPGVIVRNRRLAVPLVYDVDRTLQADAEEDLSIKIEAVGSSVVVEDIAIQALGRAFLDTDDPFDMGAQRTRFWIRQPIGERNFYTHLYGLQSTLKRTARRDPYNISWGTNNPWSTAVAGPTAVFDGTIGMLGRLLYSAETTREISWRVRAYCSDGTTAGTVDLTNTGAGTGTTITIPAGSTAVNWFPSTAGDPATFTIDAEDPSTVYGWRGGARDEQTITVTRTAGTGTIYLETLSFWESPESAPPAPTFRRITDAGEVRITDAGDTRITD